MRPPVPSELRYIMFDAEEVRVAVCQHLAFKNKRIDPRAIGRVAVFTAGTEVVADVYSARDPSASLRVETTELMQALLAFCRLNRIPLPRLSPKKLELSDGRLVLVTGTNPTPTEPKVVDGAIVYAEWAVKGALPGKA